MIKLRSDVIFEDPESRIREYCAIEVSRGYDDKHNIDNCVSRADIEAAKQMYAMIDRYDKNESKRLLSDSENISRLLSSIPNQELSNIADKEWPEMRNKIEKLLAEFLLIKGFGLAKATKILHIKRPNLFPILDSLIVKFLLDVDISDKEKDAFLDLGLRAFDAIREILTSQKTEFEELAEHTHDLPISLTQVRLFDILCWTAEKWDIRKNLNAPYGTPHESLLASFKRT